MARRRRAAPASPRIQVARGGRARLDRKSTRLNSSHDQISYAVFCLRAKEHMSVLQRRSDLRRRLLLVDDRRAGGRATEGRGVSVGRVGLDCSPDGPYFFFFEKARAPSNLTFSPPRPSSA